MGFRVPCGRGVASGALDAWGHLLVVLAAFIVYCLIHCLLPDFLPCDAPAGGVRHRVHVTALCGGIPPLLVPCSFSAPCSLCRHCS